MGRKGKQAGGNMPLTHYERTQKFASSEYGTTQQRLAGHSQYQIGDCALTTQRLDHITTAAADATTTTTTGSSVALCTPSGYIYAESAILEYLLTKTQELKAQQAACDKKQQQDAAGDEDGDKKKRIADFKESQKVVKKSRIGNAKEAAVSDLNRVSYWLSSAQPVAASTTAVDTAPKTTYGTCGSRSSSISQPPSPPERPASPMTGVVLRRKDLWPVQLQWQQQNYQGDNINNNNSNNNKVRCAISDRAIPMGAAVTAYWTDRKEPGLLVLQTVYEELKLAESQRCPITDKKIKYTRVLQKSGSSFAASGQSVQAAKYRPTIT